MVKTMEKKEVAHWLTKIKTNFMMGHKMGDSWEGFKALDAAIEQARNYPDIRIVDNVLVVDLSGVDKNIEAVIVRNSPGEWVHMAVRNED